MTAPRNQPARGSSHIPIDPAWLELHREAIIEPELPIVDPHHHLWDKPDSTYLLRELAADLASGHRVLGTVYLEAQSMYRAGGIEELRPVGEVEFANGIAAMSASGDYGPSKICAGIVGYADLTLGERARIVLEAQISAANGRLRGIRHVVAWDDSDDVRNPLNKGRPGVLSDSGFRAGFAWLAPYGLSFDAWLYHHQIPELVGLAGAFPDTAIVVNHVGGPIGIGPYSGKRDEVFTVWKRAIGELAACPNVRVKLGGLGMRLGGFGFHEREAPPSSAQLAELWKPYVETCIEAFGPKRAMFESNFPVDKGSCSYHVLWNAFKRIAQHCSTTEKADLFSEAAMRFYRLRL